MFWLILDELSLFFFKKKVLKSCINNYYILGVSLAGGWLYNYKYNYNYKYIYIYKLKKYLFGPNDSVITVIWALYVLVRKNSPTSHLQESGGWS